MSVPSNNWKTGEKHNSVAKGALKQQLKPTSADLAAFSWKGSFGP